jgi:hypothetical protein
MNEKRCCWSRDLTRNSIYSDFLTPFMVRTDHGFIITVVLGCINLKKLVMFLSSLARHKRHMNELFRLASMVLVEEKIYSNLSATKWNLSKILSLL